MTQEFVTLPSNAVEHALAALIDKCIATYAIHGTSDYMIVDDGKARAELLDALRAALQQPQNHVPDVGNMVQAGWKLVPVEPTIRQMAAMGPAIRACYDMDGVSGNVVDVYRAMLAAAPQPPTTEQSSAVEKQLVGVVGWRNHIPNSVAVVHWTGLIPPVGTELYIGQQPQGEQEPVAWMFHAGDIWKFRWHHFNRPMGDDALKYWIPFSPTRSHLANR